MKQLCSAIYITACLAALAGCDPGFVYVIPGAPSMLDNGQRYVVNVGGGVEARFHASVFTSSGTVHVQVINQSEDAIQFRFAPPEITFGAGRPVHEKRCEQHYAEDAIPIPRGKTIEVSCRFVVTEIEPGGYSSDYRSLHVELPGFSRNGAPLKIAATMQGKF